MLLDSPPTRDNLAPVGAFYRIILGGEERWCAVRSHPSDDWLSNGFGDSIHSTREEAEQAASDEAFRKAEWIKRESQRAADMEREAAERREREDTDGFADRFGPMKRGRVVATLSALQGYSGRFDTRRNHMRRFASLGFVPDTHPTEGPIVRDADDDMFYRVTATERDYLQHLLSLSA